MMETANADRQMIRIKWLRISDDVDRLPVQIDYHKLLLVGFSFIRRYRFATEVIDHKL
jgi:hypothetical protein